MSNKAIEYHAVDLLPPPPLGSNEFEKAQIQLWVMISSSWMSRDASAGRLCQMDRGGLPVTLLSADCFFHVPVTRNTSATPIGQIKSVLNGRIMIVSDLFCSLNLVARVPPPLSTAHPAKSDRSHPSK